MKSFEIKCESHSGLTVACICWLFCGSIILLSTFGCAGTRSRKTPSQFFPDTPSAELLRDIQVLQDMDSGKLESARRRLEDDSMTRVLTILEGVDFTTNKDVLCSKPGLRAAARYWDQKSLPVSASVFQSPELSNYVYRAIGIVRSELEKRKQSLDTK